jgi:hypothetical protein
MEETTSLAKATIVDQMPPGEKPFMRLFSEQAVITPRMLDQEGEFVGATALFDNVAFLLREENGLTEDKLTENGLKLVETSREQKAEVKMALGDRVRVIVRGYVEGRNIIFSGKIMRIDEIVAESVVIASIRSLTTDEEVKSLPVWIENIF